MLTIWEEINALTGLDDNFRVTLTLGYGIVSVLTMYGDDFKYTNLRQVDYKYDIKDAIEKTIERHKKELKGEQ